MGVQAIEDKEILYRSIFENTNIGILISSLEGNIIEANPSFYRRMGYGPENLSSLKIKDIFEDNETWNKLIDEFLEKGEVSDSEMKILKKDREPEWIQISIKRITLDGKVCLLSSVIDVTDCMLAEEALAKSEEKYRLLAENVTDVIWISDLDLRFTYISPSIYQLRGFSPEEAMKQTLGEILTPESLERSMEMMMDFMGRESRGELDPNQTAILEVEHYKKDGSIFWVEIHLRFLRDETVKPIGILGITRDISDRKQAENALQESLERLKGFDQHSTEGIYRVDLTKPVPIDLTREKIIDRINKHAIVGEANDSLAQMYGLEPKDMIGKPVIGFSPDYGERAALVLENKGYRVINEDTVDVNKNGEPLYLIESYHGIVKDECLFAIWGVQSDITDRKQAEETIKKEKEQVEFFLDLLGHDLGNIHTGIQGSLQLLQQNNDDSDSRKELIELAMKSVNRSISLCKEVILLSRIRNEEMVLNKLDLTEMIENAFDQVSELFPDKEVIFEKVDLGITIQAEPIMGELFFNLFHNSIRLQGDKTWLKVEAKKDNDGVRIVISDKGPGIPDQMKDIVFKNFGEKGEGVRRGLGLSIVKAIVNRFGGTIEVGDRIKGHYSKGVVFTITLPMKEN